MSGSVNLVILVGHLGADPELRQTGGGTPVCNLRIATSKRFKDRDNQPQEKTEWHRVVTWGSLAENCQQYLSRGRQVYVEGEIETREWTDKDGTKRYATEIRASQVVFLGTTSNDGARRERTEHRGGDYKEKPQDNRPAGDDDIPF